MSSKKSKYVSNPFYFLPNQRIALQHKISTHLHSVRIYITTACDHTLSSQRQHNLFPS